MSHQSLLHVEAEKVEDAAPGLQLLPLRLQPSGAGLGARSGVKGVLGGTRAPTLQRTDLKSTILLNLSSILPSRHQAVVRLHLVHKCPHHDTGRLLLPQ